MCQQPPPESAHAYLCDATVVFRCLFAQTANAKTNQLVETGQRIVFAHPRPHLCVWMASCQGKDLQDAEVVRALMLEACKVGKTLDASEVGASAMLVEVLKQYLHTKARRLVEANRSAPMHLSYQFDASSYVCQTTAGASAAGNRVLRRGKVLEEFLMERGCIHILRPSGKMEAALLVGEPRSLEAGKKAWNLLVAAASFFPLARKLGHKGINVFHFGSDGAMFSALDRLLRQRRQAYYNPGMGPDLGGDRDQLCTTDILVSIGCACHDVSNALKWAFPATGGAETLKDLHIGIESLRNSYRQLHQHLPTFLRHHIAVAPPAHNDDVPSPCDAKL